MVAQGLGRPRMTLDANPEYMYGTRGRKRRWGHATCRARAKWIWRFTSRRKGNNRERAVLVWV